MAKAKSNVGKDDKEALEALLTFIRDHRGFDFSAYKPGTLERRIRKRLGDLGMGGFGQYQDFLQVHPDEFAGLFNAILINVTSFFRDPDSWTYLAERVLPKLIENREADEPLRAWSAGCASGEEAYSIAMLLAEALPPGELTTRVKVYATDIDEEALLQARQATYGPSHVETVPPELRQKYFERVGNKLVARVELRRAVVFGRHDLLRDAPISRIDVLLCRNILMYFNADAQQDALARLHYALREDGVLFLGKAEMLLGRGSPFVAVSQENRMFSKGPVAVVSPLRPATTTRGFSASPGGLLRDAAFGSSPMAQMVVDRDGILVMANDEARAHLNVDSKSLGQPLRDLEISYRPAELRAPIEEAVAARRTVHMRDVSHVTAAGTVSYDVHIAPLFNAADELFGTSVTFEDVSRHIDLQQEAERSSEALRTAYAEIQTSSEELETMNEELQSANEELQTTNEELQSANEELETMNEELQATNEELRVTNERLRDRGEEVRTAHEFLQAILDGLPQGSAVVDKDLRVLSWSDSAEDLWGLRPAEAVGQHFLGLEFGLDTAKLKRPVRAVISGKNNHWSSEFDALTRRGRAIRCRVDVTPVLTRKPEVIGALILMENLATP